MKYNTRQQLRRRCLFGEIFRRIVNDSKRFASDEANGFARSEQGGVIDTVRNGQSFQVFKRPFVILMAEFEPIETGDERSLFLAAAEHGQRYVTLHSI